MFDFDADSGEIFLYGVIGDDEDGLIGENSVVLALSEMKDKHVTVRINSPGGHVDTGISIFNALKRHKRGVSTAVDALAASIASYIFMAGEKRVVASNSAIMIHKPHGPFRGNAKEARAFADLLDGYESRIAPEYAARTGKSAAEVEQLLEAETWYFGNQIVDAGFADSVVGGKKYKPITNSLEKWAKVIPPVLAEQRESDEYIERFPLRMEAKRNRPLTVAEARAMMAKL